MLVLDVTDSMSRQGDPIPQVEKHTKDKTTNRSSHPGVLMTRSLTYNLNATQIHAMIYHTAAVSSSILTLVATPRPIPKTGHAYGE